MGAVEVLHGGTLTTIQDEGRLGWAYWSVSPSGAMDRDAYRWATAIVQNRPGSAAIECALVPPRLRFLTPALIGLSGADFHWSLDDTSIPRDRTIRVPAGAVLSGRPAENGLWGYLAIAGELQGDRAGGSLACDTSGGLGYGGGRPLQRGQTVGWDEPVAERLAMEIVREVEEMSWPAIDAVTIPLWRGPEFPSLASTSQRDLFAQPFQVTPSYNRMAARLTGPPLRCDGPLLLDSVAVVPGCVQSPPSGDPLVVLRDGQTTGGYPRIGYLDSTALARFVRVRLGGKVRFVVQESDA